MYLSEFLVRKYDCHCTQIWFSLQCGEPKMRLLKMGPYNFTGSFLEKSSPLIIFRYCSRVLFCILNFFVVSAICSAQSFSAQQLKHRKLLIFQKWVDIFWSFFRHNCILCWPKYRPKNDWWNSSHKNFFRENSILSSLKNWKMPTLIIKVIQISNLTSFLESAGSILVIRFQLQALNSKIIFSILLCTARRIFNPWNKIATTEKTRRFSKKFKSNTFLSDKCPSSLINRFLAKNLV